MTEMLVPGLFLLQAGLQIADVWTTRRALAAGGREANPLIAAFMRWFGGYWWLPKLAIAAAALVTLWPARQTGFGIAALVGLNALFLFICIRNWRRGSRLRRKGALPPPR